MASIAKRKFDVVIVGAGGSGMRASLQLSLAGLNEWRYWLFQYRIKNCDPEKVASDTRKGLAVLQRLEMCAKARVSVEPEQD